MRLTYAVTSDDIGAPLRTLLSRRLMLSTAQVHACRAADSIRVDGAPFFLNQAPPIGATVTVDLPTPPLPGDLPVEHAPLSILFEDEALIALHKPASLLVHPSRAQYAGTLLGAVLGHLADTGQPLCAHPVHRLDRGTSGIVLFAKHPHAQARWMAAHAAGQVAKRYVGVVWGVPEPPEGEIRLSIRRAQPQAMLRIVSDDGQAAHTRYRVISTALTQGHPVSCVAFEPITGRTHQLRVHSLAIGHPLLGDRLYHTPDAAALSAALGLSDQLLHAESLCFPHPISGEPVELFCPMTRGIAGITPPALPTPPAPASP